MDADELKYVYHENGQQFIQVLPTFSALFSFELEPSGAIDLPGLQHDPRLLLHGQQYMELYEMKHVLPDCMIRVKLLSLRLKPKVTMQNLVNCYA